MRPVSTHGLRIADYCSYRGLLVLSGVDLAFKGGNDHIIRSDDGKTALWAGAIDDVWDLGKPVGSGGPWKDSLVAAGAVSDPYLMTGYDRKRLSLRSDITTAIRVEVDISGMGDWQTYRTFEASPDQEMEHLFPDSFQAYWIRFHSAKAATVTTWLEYE